MDDFVRNQLISCGCAEYISVFQDNEVDEAAFRMLEIDDIRQLIPGKVGPQRRIMSCISSLPSQVHVEEVNPNSGVENAQVVPEVETERNGRHDSTKVAVEHERYLEAPLDAPSVDDNSAANINSQPDALSQLLLKFGFDVSKRDSDAEARPAVVNSRQSTYNIGFHVSPNVTVNGNIDTKIDSSRYMHNVNTTVMPMPVENRKPLKKVPHRIKQHQQKLPVHELKEEFVEMVRKNQVAIVEGETGSGKSTQLTQYLCAAKFAENGKIGCTQPRRIAARALAKRVAEEMGATLGEEVGYKIRFENKSLNTTAITYMTDGILLQDLASHPKIYNYSVVMLDEAHERSLNTDILLGLLKKAAKARKDLRIIVASATLDAQKFSQYFFGAPIIRIQGRDYPVDIRYQEQDYQFGNGDYVTSCIQKVLDISRYQPEGDILVFLCGQDRIEFCVDKLEEKDTKNELWIVPCYAALRPEEQSKVFEPAPEGKRKVVIATNIAETSLTIDGIVYVVDSGVSKVSKYDPKTGLKTLAVEMISKAQATQRAGRAGRTRPGIAYRLYTKEAYLRMKDNPVPEIQRSNLEHCLLLLASHGVEDFYSFDYLDRPSNEQLEESIKELQYLGAIDKYCKLTELGREIVKYPLDPRLSKVLLTSVKLNCVEEVLTIVAMLTVQSSAKIYYRPKKKQYQADKCKEEFNQLEGDFHTFLKVWQCWTSYGYSDEYCRNKFLNSRALNEVYEIRDQLVEIMRANKVRVSPHKRYLEDPEAVQKALLSGFYNRIARKESSRGKGFGYRGSDFSKDLLYIHASSSLMKVAPGWVMFEELINTGDKAFMVNVTEIKPSWVREYAPDYYMEFLVKFPSQMISY